MIPDRGIIAYFFPISALTMMVVVLVETRLVFILTTVLALLIGYIATDAPQAIVIYLILSGWTGALAIGKDQRVTALLWAGIYVGMVNVVVIFALHPSASTDFTGLGILLLIGLLNGIFSAGLSSIGLSVIGNLVGITTSIQLLDLGRPTHPLLRQLLLKAPGTYHHSLMVSNLGEQAAERIGANSLLVRVMAYYHDVGKMQRPYFFIENQPEGINVHEKLDPQISAQIIISHVKDGLDLAHKYRLPQALKDGIAQHHGTSLVKYFYYQAVEAAKEKEIQVDPADFIYPGPKPQTRENGILMLADVSESTVRALKPGSAEEIDEIVYKVISDKLDTGQLDECELSVADLHQIRSAFVDILQGVHHPRIKYPEQIKLEAQKATDQAERETPTPETSSVPQPAAPPKPRPGLTLEPPPRPATLIRRE
jgi:putative nucleotidyltransferase with HDIG domain